MDPIYPDFPVSTSIPKVAPLRPDRLDPDQRREQDTESQHRKKSDAEDEADEAVTEDLSSSETESDADAPRKRRARRDIRRGSDGDGHIDITV